MTASIEVDATEAMKSIRLLRIGLERAYIEVGRSVLGAMRDDAKGTTLWKDQTGDTRKSIHDVQDTITEGFVEAGEASRYLEYGTPDHGPVRAKALRFEINGHVIFRRFVRGITARPFMQHARDRGEITAEYATDYYLNEAIRAHP